jgi:hypothetical protein
MPYDPTERPPAGIGTLGEKSLHAALKAWYSRPGDEFEVPVSGYIADLVRDGLLIEIQTRNFSAIRPKLARLLEDHPLRLLHPIAGDRWIVHLGSDGRQQTRRKSPKHGRILDIFNELVYIPDLIAHPNLAIEAVLIQEEEVRVESSRWSWRRRGWKSYDRRLLDVLDQACFTTLQDFQNVLPDPLPDPFSNRELASALDCSYNLAQKITYTLREADALYLAGKRGNSLLYRR